MRNPLTFRVESAMGAVFLSATTAFFIAFLFIVIKNFNSEVDSLQAGGYVRVRAVSATERTLIDNWLSDKQLFLDFPQNQSKYNYIVKQYPNKPWLR